jgi:hypothetical protein
VLHVGVGRRHCGRIITMLVADRDVRVLTEEGEVIRHFQINLERNLQRLSVDEMSTMS